MNTLDEVKTMVTKTFGSNNTKLINQDIKDYLDKQTTGFVVGGSSLIFSSKDTVRKFYNNSIDGVGTLILEIEKKADGYLVNRYVSHNVQGGKWSYSK